MPKGFLKMQRTKNIRLLISLAVLLIATALVLILGSSERSAVDKSLFQIPEQEKVDRVVFESPKGKTEISYDGTRWKVNNQYEADGQLIKIFFATTMKAEAKREVPALLREKVSSALKSNGTKVSFFKSGNLVKEFTVGGNEGHTETYFSYDNKNSYVVTIPGYRAYVASVFEMTANDWRNKQIFNFNPQNFKSLEATFPSNPKEDFKINFTGKLFEVEGITKLDTAQLNSYLDVVSFIAADRIVEQGKVNADSLLQLTPFEKIVVKDIGGNEYPLTIYPFDRTSTMITGSAFKNEVVQFTPQNIIATLKSRKDFIRK